jgi:hypothetical protein
MKRVFARRAAVGLACVVLIAAVILVLPVAKVKATSSGTLSACVNPGNGNMRLVSDSSQCHANESFVTWNISGPPGPPGPTGPTGPAGSSAGGPPFVWICTPANFPNTAGSSGQFLYVYNGGSSSATIAVNILDKTGHNLQGVAIPGAVPPAITTYPGDPDGSTETLAPANTAFFQWSSPTTGGPGFDGVTNVSFSVRITSTDQPITVGSNFSFGAFNPNPCSLLPK